MVENVDYFNPNIEDIYVGYECEVAIPDFSRYLNFHSAETYRDFIIGKLDRPEPYEFEKKNLTRDDIRHYMIYEGYLPIRTPYLTGEQIVAEGWEDISEQKVYDGDYKKEEYYINIVNYLRDGHPLKVFIGITRQGKTCFAGECPDINTFRYICKLLNIK